MFPQWFETDFARPLLYWGKEPPEGGKKLMAEGKIPWYKNLLGCCDERNAQSEGRVSRLIGAQRRARAHPAAKNA